MNQRDDATSPLERDERMAQWEGWARVRGDELQELTGGRSPIVSDGLADEMKEALEGSSLSATVTKEHDYDPKLHRRPR